MKKLVLLLTLVLCVGCAGFLNLNSEEPEIPYYEALRFFNGAWESYHKVWIHLPEEKKIEWVNKYHTKFDDATLILDVWALDPEKEEYGISWKSVKASIEKILIETAIKSSQ